MWSSNFKRSDREIIYRSFYGEEFKLSTETEPTIKPLRLVVMEHGPFDSTALG